MAPLVINRRHVVMVIIGKKIIRQATVTIIPTEGATDRPKNVVVPTPAYMLALERPHFYKLVFSLDLSWPVV